MNKFNLITFIASVLLVIEVYLSLIVICSSKETAFFKIRQDFLFLNTNNVQGRISGQLEAIILILMCIEKHNYDDVKAFSRSTKILIATTLPFLIVGNFPVLKNYFSSVYHSFEKHQDKCTAN